MQVGGVEILLGGNAALASVPPPPEALALVAVVRRRGPYAYQLLSLRECGRRVVMHESWVHAMRAAGRRLGVTAWAPVRRADGLILRVEGYGPRDDQRPVRRSRRPRRR